MTFAALRSLGLAVAATILLGCASAQAEELKVTIDNFTFTPAELKVKVGDTVTWTNHDDIPHSIVLNSLAVRSKTMDTDGTFAYKFDKAGTFFYVCGLHPFMQAKVVVK